MDLLGMLKDQVSGTLAGQASKFLGESESSVGKALGGIFPALLGSTIGAAKNEAGAGKVLDLLKGMDTGGMDNIAGIFGGGASGVSKLMNQGSGVLNLLLGNKSGGMIDSIAKFAGLRGSSASSLIKMAAPFLMKMIGGHIMKNKLGASGLMDFLGGQKSAVQSAMPAGLSGVSFLDGLSDKAGDALKGVAGAGKNVVGGATDAAGKVVGGAADAGKKLVGSATGAVGNVAGAATGVAGAAVKKGGGLLRWLLPLLLIGGACAIFLPGYFNKAKEAASSVVDKAGDAAGAAAGAVGDVAGKAGEMAGDAAGAVGDVVGDAAGAVGDVVGDAAGAVGDAAGKLGDAVGGVFGNINEAAKGALDKITFTAGSAGSQMMDYVKGGFKGDPNFTFKGLTFATGSANIDAKTAAEVDNVAAILKTYPDVKVAVSGYTDNTGDAAKNVQLSKARAQAVKTRLVNTSGIAANRISVNGLGAANPVADNSTPEGRRQNRRIEMKIAK